MNALEAKIQRLERELDANKNLAIFAVQALRDIDRNAIYDGAPILDCRSTVQDFASRRLRQIEDLCRWRDLKPSVYAQVTANLAPFSQDFSELERRINQISAQELANGLEVPNCRRLKL